MIVRSLAVSAALLLAGCNQSQQQKESGLNANTASRPDPDVVGASNWVWRGNVGAAPAPLYLVDDAV